jgi:GAF domain-containing protein
LVARQRLVGLLVLSSEKKSAFTEEEKELLVAMGREAGILIENANLFRALQEAYDELHTTYEVSVAISQSIDLERTIKQIVKSAQKALNASNCFLFLLDERRNELVGAAATTPDRDFTVLRIGMREMIAGAWVVKEKQPLSIRDLSNDPRACPTLRDRYHQKSALFVPLIVNDAAIGTIVLDDTEKERVFSEGEVRRAQSKSKTVPGGQRESPGGDRSLRGRSRLDFNASTRERPGSDDAHLAGILWLCPLCHTSGGRQ